jgi:hypothetical protein
MLRGYIAVRERPRVDITEEERKTIIEAYSLTKTGWVVLYVSCVAYEG